MGMPAITGDITLCGAVGVEGTEKPVWAAGGGVGRSISSLWSVRIMLRAGKTSSISSEYF
jgi:hypothetical protein